ncbi:hypothetical protein [Halorubrum sp. DTA98]|uniref:hypothetical protein n=1 Tax=Halorubrum sp. DTA98 TaxID=3402163 RepID=UPI003AB06B06
MLLTQVSAPDTELVDQIAGITGLGWTASLLGYAISVIGYGNSVIGRLVVEPRSLLYVGTVLFVVTLGLDRFQRTLTDGKR